MEDVKSGKVKMGDVGLGNMSRSKELSGVRLLSRGTTGKRGDNKIAFLVGATVRFVWLNAE
jgi:hypothetical protein